MNLSSNNKMNDILNKSVIYDKDEQITHTTLNPPRKYNISRKDIDALFDNNTRNTLTEMPQFYSQLRFDFDIMKDEYEESFYTDDIIHDVIKIIQKQVKLQTVNFKNRLNTVCLLEKPVYKKNIRWSGGFHLQFPFLFLETKKIWSSIVEPIIDEVFLKTRLVFDNIYTKPWYIYGSSKSFEHVPYTLTKVFDYDCNETPIKFLESAQIYDQNEKLIKEDLDKHLVRILSILPFNRDINDIIEIKKEVKIIEKKVYEKSDADINEVKMLVKMLPKYRVEDFNEWFQLGCCLWSIGNGDDEYLCIWDEKSQESDKYEARICDMYWSKMKESKYTIGSLKYWVKQDTIGVQKTQTIIKHDKYVGDDIYDQQITLIRAGLGRGKTTSFIQYINNTKYKNIICLTSRKTFATSLCNRLNDETTRKFKLYTDKCFDISALVIQAESLHKLQDINFGDDTLIIVDECESFLQQMTSTTTHKANHQTNFDVFLKMLDCKIIFMDAFLDNKTLTFLGDCNKKYNLYDYLLPPDVRNAIEINPTVDLLENGKIDYDYFSPFCNKMMSLISQGKKGYIFIASKNSLKGFLQYINGTFPNIKKAVYYGDKKDCLQDVNDSWSKMDLVICNSALTIGVNFDIKNHFDFIACYIEACVSNLVRDMFQSFYRIRHVETLYYSVDPKLYNFNLSTTTNIVEIKKEFYNINFWFQQHYDEHFPTNIPICKTYEKAIFNLFVNATLEQSLSVREIKSEFDKYLKICGYININDNEPVILVPKGCSITGDTPYENIPEITQKEYYCLLNNQFRKESDTLILEKYVFQQTIWYNKIDGYSLKALWAMFKNCDDKKKMRNIAYEKSLQDKTIAINSIVSHALPILVSKMSLKLEIVNNLTKWLGLKNTYDTTKPIKKDDKLIGIFKENVKKIYDIFKIKDRRKTKDGKFMNGNFNDMDFKTVIMITNQVFSKWGYSTIKKSTRKREMINGIRSDISDYIIEIDKDIYDNIIPYNYKEQTSTLERPNDGNDNLQNNIV